MMFIFHLTHSVAKIPFIHNFLYSDYERPYYCVWGLRPSSLKFRKTHPVISLEDGFLRSFRPGQSYPPLSIVVDNAGVYYDCNRSNDLEDFVNKEQNTLDGKIYAVKDVIRARLLLVFYQLSKYNHAPDFNPHVFQRYDWQQRKKVLVIDQTAGDMSII